MAEKTGIAWTDHTWSPWWGCNKVSAGCANCYADTLSHRWGYDIWGTTACRRFFGEHHWNEPTRWNRAAEKAGARRRVFLSMCDPFEDRTDLEGPRIRLLRLIGQTSSLDWLLLTKRPENVIQMLPSWWISRPVHNIWLGTSVEDQKIKNRIDELKRCSAALRFLSLEPLLEDLGALDLTGIGWVIVGGESGPKARPCNVEWIRSVVQQCKAAKVPVFVKQLGANVRDRNDAGFMGDQGDAWGHDRVDPLERVEHNPDGVLEEYQGAPVRIHLRDTKGGDPAEWPEDLRVREMPEVRK